MRRLIMFIAYLLLTGCTSGYYSSYHRINNVTTLLDVTSLDKDSEPDIFMSRDLESDTKYARLRGFYPIGKSYFNGRLEPEEAVIKQAKSVGAVIVLVNTKFTGNVTTTVPLFLPNTHTTSFSGSVMGPSGISNYSGTSTTYDTTVVPITSHQENYNQGAVFFVKVMEKQKFGIGLIDLPLVMMMKYERTTGTLVDFVAENSPASEANVMPGDIVIEINSIPIVNVKQAIELTKSIYPESDTCILKIIRNSREKIINIKPFNVKTY